MKITQKELVTFAESITSALEEIATKIGAVEDIISGDKEIEEVVDDEEVEVEIDEDEDVDEDTEVEDEEVVADEEVADEETPVENFSERLKNVKNFLNM